MQFKATFIIQPYLSQLDGPIGEPYVGHVTMMTFSDEVSAESAASHLKQDFIDLVEQTDFTIPIARYLRREEVTNHGSNTDRVEQ